MNEALSVVSGALWSFLLCFFDVAFFWQRVRQLPSAVSKTVLGQLMCLRMEC
jgi:hypothetical protein